MLRWKFAFSLCSRLSCGFLWYYWFLWLSAAFPICSRMRCLHQARAVCLWLAPLVCKTCSVPALQLQPTACCFLRHSYFQMLPVWGGERFSMWLLNEPRVWKGSFSAGYFLGRLLIATEDVNACQRVWGILSTALTLSFEAELFRTEQILSRPMNSSVPESLPAAAKFKECFTQALTEAVIETLIPPPCAVQGLQHRSLPSRVNSPPWRLQ